MSRNLLRLLPLALPFTLYALASCSGDDTSGTGSDAGGSDAKPDQSVANDSGGGSDAARDAGTGGDADAGAAQGLAKLNHIVVIYMENHSFDNLYGEFAGAEGLAQLDAGAPNVQQVDQNGAPYATLPPPGGGPDGGPFPGFPTTLPNAPFPIEDYVGEDAATPDLHHLFYTEQFQIADGGMNRFALWSDAKGLAMGHYHTNNLPVATLAKSFTVCDHFFHSAFGGSFLNHMWLIAAQTPQWPSPPDAGLYNNPDAMVFGQGEKPLTSDNFIVNTAFSVNSPRPPFNVAAYVPNLTFDTIGDRLTAKGVSWGWYSGGWNDAVSMANDAGVPEGGVAPSVEKFQYHHQPFIYFANYADGTPGRAQHLKDQKDFLAAAAAGTLPAVSFVKPVGIDNEHPGYTDVLSGDTRLLALIQAIQASPNYADTAIIITYDEHGGFWDHVPPPSVDRWGPGARVPAIVISKYAKKGFVDHTVYDTTSILATIEKRFGIAPLSTRDANAKDMSAAFDFTQ